MEELDPNILKLLEKFKKNSTKKINRFLIKEPVVESTSVKKNNSNFKLQNNLDTQMNIARATALANSNVPKNSASHYKYEEDLKNFEIVKGIKTDALGNPILDLNVFSRFKRYDMKKNITGLTQKQKEFENIQTEKDFFKYRIKQAKEFSTKYSHNLPKAGDEYYPTSELSGENMGKYKNKFIDEQMSLYFSDEYKNFSLTDKSNLIRKYRIPIRFHDIRSGSYAQVIDTKTSQSMEIDLRNFVERPINGDGRYDENLYGERFKKLNPVLEHELSHAEHGFGAAGTTELLDFTKNSLGIKNSNNYISNRYSELDFRSELGARYNATKYLLGINKKGFNYSEFKDIVTPKLDSLIQLKNPRDINVEQISSISDELLGKNIMKNYNDNDLKNLYKIYNKF